MKLRLIILILVLLNLLLAGLNCLNQSKNETIFVLTPLVDIWQASPPLTQDEREKLEQEFSFQPESRGLERIYSHMGATLSFHDLLRGVQFLESSKTPLSGEQKKQVFEKLKTMQQDHKKLQQLQKNLMRKEEEIADILERLEQQ